MIETVALAGSVVGYVAKTIKENKDVKKFFSDFTSATVNWLRPIFLEHDDKPTEILKDLSNSPDDELYQESAKLAIARLVKKDSANSELLKALVDAITEKEGEINSGYSIKQTHYGSGDNIGRDKNINK